ncbi:hypothetical protein PILCRDRAFT_820590 [Piloderma croceum F 1598]|uniref:Utp14-domain-containing protein n=1 Tax=Piloderma croceum (strain F 1598) TaxID=765440 RepID=A0A0C3FR92_PILCF|nr:hypothetical protein PILCRDRAFT_820590 [Piloderma croceum F 1598]
MARTSRNAPGNKGRPNSHKANATGYAKRHSLKAKTLAGLSDVYEYAPDSKTRRSKVTLEISRNEAAEIGLGRGGGESDDEGMDGEDMRTKARLIGEGDVIDSGDDEDIDSDAAFEESDEERFAGFGFNRQNNKKGPTKRPKKRGAHLADVDLNEDVDSPSEVSENSDNEDEEIEGDADDFIDVLDVFDGKAEDMSDSGGAEKHDLARKQRTQQADAVSANEVEDDEEDNSGEEEDPDDDQSEEEAIVVSASDGEEDTSPEALISLGNFISALEPSKKRKAPTDEDPTPADAPQTRKRRIIKERTEAGPENEFGAQATASTKLKLDDLLAPLASQSTNLLGLKKSAKVLASTSGAKTLSAPLPQRTQERVDREAAYEQTKEEVDKWTETMKRIKEAEHLSFPLQAQPTGRVSNLELAAKFKPTTELESSVNKLLKSAKLRDEDLQETEQLAMNHLSVEEVAARRAELRKMRELMFRAEVKAKRVSKIKSKTYRRIKKKEREKLTKKLDKDEDMTDEGVRLKMEVERARERATLRHKNTGKWAKAMKAKGELDVDERREISEMLERGEQLRRRIRGDEESDDEDDDDSEVDEEGDGLSRIKASAFEELAKINRDNEDGIATDGQGKKGKTIFEMKFMQDAMARNQQQTDRMVDDFVKEMGENDGESDAEEVVDTGEDASGRLAVQRTGGRAVYHPTATSGQMAAQPLNSLASDSSSVTLQSADLPQGSPPPDHRPVSRPVPIPLTSDSNPWLVPRETTSKAPRKKNEVVVDKNSSTVDKSMHKLNKQGKALSSNTTVEAPSDDSDSDSEIEEQEKALSQKGKGKSKGVKSFEQRDLVARAFAGDNVVQAFEDAKRREMAEDAPRTVDTTIPGWGSWGGSGTRRQPTKPHLIKRVAGIDPSTRSDFNKKHVIVSEKRDKKAAKYMVKDLPYPYTSKAQFERSINMPLGTEWNTRVGFQRGTLPKVVKKMGTVINPLEKLF